MRLVFGEIDHVAELFLLFGNVGIRGRSDGLSFFGMKWVVMQKM